MGTRFLRNISNGRGGAMYASIFRNMDIEECSFSRCQSLENGGGALSFVGAANRFNLPGNVSINDSRFYKNEALSAGTGLGGAILVEGKFVAPGLVSLAVSGSRFIRNAANSTSD